MYSFAAGVDATLCRNCSKANAVPSTCPAAATAKHIQYSHNTRNNRATTLQKTLQTSRDETFAVEKLLVTLANHTQ
jgi:hypothetical protein